MNKSLFLFLNCFVIIIITLFLAWIPANLFYGFLNEVLLIDGFSSLIKTNGLVINSIKHICSKNFLRSDCYSTTNIKINYVKTNTTFICDIVSNKLYKPNSKINVWFDINTIDYTNYKTYCFLHPIESPDYVLSIVLVVFTGIILFIILFCSIINIINIINKPIHDYTPVSTIELTSK